MKWFKEITMSLTGGSSIAAKGELTVPTATAGVSRWQWLFLATLLAAIEEQPLTYISIVPRIHAQKLLKNLHDELPADIYAAAVERGKTENIHELFREMMTVCNKIDTNGV